MGLFSLQLYISAKGTWTSQLQIIICCSSDITTVVAFYFQFPSILVTSCRQYWSFHLYTYAPKEDTTYQICMVQYNPRDYTVEHVEEVIMSGYDILWQRFRIGCSVSVVWLLYRVIVKSRLSLCKRSIYYIFKYTTSMQMRQLAQLIVRDRLYTISD